MVSINVVTLSFWIHTHTHTHTYIYIYIYIPTQVVKRRGRWLQTVAYRGILFGGGGQQIQLRTEDRENGDLGAVAP